jgi:hypothetical protein
MHRRPIVTPPRISTMPRAQTEARLHLDRYQIAIEKKRLEKELETIESRQVQIRARLIQFTQEEVATAQLQQQVAPENSPAIPTQKKHPVKTFNSESYQTFLLDF